MVTPRAPDILGRAQPPVTNWTQRLNEAISLRTTVIRWKQHHGQAQNNDLQYDSPLTENQKENTPSTSKTRSKALSSQPTMPSHEPLGRHSFAPAPF
ncbi:uncharacterized protein CCOS01_08567 [Colletotrichum costaricense]|uniref:Uncharacterized protein n=1 Tax=Colletotrichum costaricense TaxID=1209916 RepID=A0AAJ0E0H7_9PEZI|nr:uncharacterized protein CCOS01_08567 [Colletotrichum costaricense]KAK1526149.1 hypothetical protein CCOS01_08567 [Colletotrichum costaricense]